MKTVLVLLAALCSALPGLADAPRISHGPRELGRVILWEVAVRDGQLVFRTDSNGCTRKGSFRVNVARDAGVSAGMPNFRLSIERIAADECKAIEWDGVKVAFDLAKDLGLTGSYTVSIDNPIQQKGVGAGAAEPSRTGADLRPALLEATRRAFQMEIDTCRARLMAAEGGTGSNDNVGRFRGQLAALERDKAKFDLMKPEDYPAPAARAADIGGVFDKAAAAGPVLPPVSILESGTFAGTPREGAQISAERATRSGPFYHLAGIAGGNYEAVEKDREYRFDLFLVYKRDYFAFIPDYYVYVEAAR